MTPGTPKMPTTVETPESLAATSATDESCPVLPRPSTARSADALRELRRFHFAPPEAGGTPLAGDPAPALLRSAGAAGLVARPYPLFLGPPEDEALCLGLGELLQRLLAEAAPELESELRDLAAGAASPIDARELVEKASHAAARELLAALPAGGRFLPYGPEAPFHLLRHAAESRLHGARRAFRGELRALVDQARRSEAPEEGSLASLGELGGRFLDPTALAEVVQGTRQKASSAAAVREDRLRDDLGVLESFLADERPAEILLVHDGRSELTLGDGYRVETSDDPCAAAAELFDRQGEDLARVLRAVRRMRLAAAGEYEPERHDPWLEQLDWQAFSRAELRLLPPVVALLAADDAAGAAMASLSRLLLSGRPVQVVVLVRPLANPGAEALSGFRLEPAYLGLAHREVLVQQTAATRPAHMMRGYLRALEATHTALHVIAATGCDLMAVEARAHPLFHYDPEAGSRWADRFDFSLNPGAEDDWPAYDLTVAKEAGGEDVLRLPFTFADFALSEPACHAHFLAVPEGVPDGELTPIADYCAAPVEDQAAAIPFVWSVDAQGHLRRLAVSRPLALACRDRLGYWRTLQELAGVANEYARRAAASTREEVEAQALEERQRLERLHAEELDRLRRDAARDVVDRLTSALLDVDVTTFAAPADAGAQGAAGAFRGQSVEDVSAALLRLVDPAALAGEGGGAAAPDERVGQMAAELLRALGEDV